MAKRAAEQELEKKGDKKRASIMGDRLKGINEEQYRRMQAAVDAAMVPETLQPIILMVEDRTDVHEYDYDLALYPSDRGAALHLLQRLEVTEGERHFKLVEALYDVDEQWRDKSQADEEACRLAKQTAQDRMLAECGIVAAVGRIERVDDMEVFSPFLYFQRCWRSSSIDDDDDDKDDESSNY